MQFKVCLNNACSYIIGVDTNLHANLIMCLFCSEIVEECVNQHLSKKDNKQKGDNEKKKEQENDEVTAEEVFLALLSHSISSAQSRSKQ